MHITGIIAEYNPFHNGHAYQIAQVRAKHPDSLIIAVMSGSFTQRGETAILDKWTRAKLAVRGGCDLVLELPFAFACRSAQDFARGGVTLLERLGIVDTLAFGAESSELTRLSALAATMDSEATQAKLQAKIKSGLSYASALTAALDEQNTSLLTLPNNILAIEYLRSLSILHSSIEPLLIPRRGASYHDMNIDTPNASASAIRQLLYRHNTATANVTNTNVTTDINRCNVNNCDLTAEHYNSELQHALPARVYEELWNCDLMHLPDMNQLFLLLRYELMQMPVSKLQSFYSINEGIENRIIASARTNSDYESFIHAVTTKRYPASRIRRTMIYLLLQLRQSEVTAFDEAGPLYARLLAVSGQGRKLLPLIKQHASIPLITKLGPYLKQKDQRVNRQDLPLLSQMLCYDTLATDLRQLALAPARGRNDWQVSPLFLS